MLVKNSEFLPETPKEGYIGFYPGTVEEWSNLPLPLRCSTWYHGVEYVIFSVWLDHYKISTKVAVHRQDVFKVLFCEHGNGPLLYEVSAVQFQDGRKTFAKWWQDSKTGCFQISGINGTVYGTQGGFSGHVPENCYKNDNDEWKLDSSASSRSENIIHCSF